MQFAGYVLDRLVEPQAGFDRDHQQVERIGQGKTQISWRFFTFFSRKNRGRTQPAMQPETMQRDASSSGSAASCGCIDEAHHQHHQRAHDAHAVEYRQRRFRSGSRRGSDRPRRLAISASEEGTREPICCSTVTSVLPSAPRRSRPIRRCLASRDHRGSELLQNASGLVDTAVARPRCRAAISIRNAQMANKYRVIHIRP